jgi:ADP-heptose:LPS heptosyltransferase
MSELLEAFPDGAEYHLLQKELRATDKAALLRRPDIVRYDSDIQDFADTAAICEKMDLVVTVDTSVAHLAGALGKKTLLMTPLWPEWRWGLGRSKSKWYPNTQIVRQLTAGDWSPVFEFIAIAVDKEIKLKRREAA